MMTNIEFINKLIDIAKNYKTAYMWGTFGSPISENLIKQKATQYSARYSSARQAYLKGLVSKGYWAFDCVGLIKGILWGWNGNKSKTYGGATYASNGVPDTTASGILAKCKEVSTKITTSMLPGTALYREGHIGVYIGNGEVVECTLSGGHDGVVITKLTDGGWTKCGKLPYISYVSETSSSGSSTGSTSSGASTSTPGSSASSSSSGASASTSSTASKTIKAGSKVKLRPGAKIFGTNNKFASFVYNDVWVVERISLLNKKKVLINKNAKGTNKINSWANLDDLVLQ